MTASLSRLNNKNQSNLIPSFCFEPEEYVVSLRIMESDCHPKYKAEQMDSLYKKYK